MAAVRQRQELDLLALAAVGAIAAFVTTLCVVVARYPVPRQFLIVVITGLGAGSLILYRQLRKAANSLAASEARAHYVATHDTVTQLPNKALFVERLEAAAKTAGIVGSDRARAVLCIGINQFDEVADVLGVAASEAVAAEIASRLNSAPSTEDTVARLGDDTFAVLWSGRGDGTPRDAAAGLIEALGKPYRAAAGQAHVTCSIGLGDLAPGLDSPMEALRHARLALSKARKLDGAHYSTFEPALDQALKDRKALETELRADLADKVLHLVYQPQVNANGALVGVEALMRWTNRRRGAVSPGVFIPLSESCGLSDEVGRFAIRQAFTDARLWPDLKVAINVSAAHIRSGDLIPALKELVRQTGASPRNFELELTESVLLADEAQTYETLNTMRRMGFGIALDDFGTGYSSLSYLRRFPVDKIKIDQSFVTHLGKRPEARAIVKAIVDMAEALDLKVIAEGVETKAQADRLRQLGCQLYQGYLFSKAVTADTLVELVAGRVKLAA
jgi:diguanylate cyclase (GGDEF)-like protein